MPLLITKQQKTDVDIMSAMATTRIVSNLKSAVIKPSRVIHSKSRYTPILEHKALQVAPAPIEGHEI